LKPLYKHDKLVQKEFENLYAKLAKLLSGKNSTPEEIKKIKKDVKKLQP